ncbi:uncharacterized protein LOC106731726 isoform X2 [Pelodiscus sinensis]|uniref:uncharacterized protein LOC106731726 isoform X2 n=1 Tax=Pelodiscus sinensis TaxID=13735 RepID=UPI003F6B4775
MSLHQELGDSMHVMHKLRCSCLTRHAGSEEQPDTIQWKGRDLASSPIVVVESRQDMPGVWRRGKRRRRQARLWMPKSQEIIMTLKPPSHPPHCTAGCLPVCCQPQGGYLWQVTDNREDIDLIALGTGLETIWFWRKGRGYSSFCPNWHAESGSRGIILGSKTSITTSSIVMGELDLLHLLFLDIWIHLNIDPVPSTLAYKDPLMDVFPCNIARINCLWLLVA